MRTGEIVTPRTTAESITTKDAAAIDGAANRRGHFIGYPFDAHPLGPAHFDPANGAARVGAWAQRGRSRLCPQGGLPGSEFPGFCSRVIPLPAAGMRIHDEFMDRMVFQQPRVWKTQGDRT